MLRLRVGVAAAAAVILGSLGALSACGSLANNAAFSGGGPFDGGEQSDSSTDAGPGNDAPAEDGSSDAISPLPPPGALLVHASPSLPDLVFCWSVGGAGPSTTLRPYPSATPMPASNYPGVPVGGAVGLADASSMMGTDLSVVALDARAVARAVSGIDCSNSSQCSCSALLSNNGAVDPTAIHQLPLISSAQAIVPGATVVLWLRGCLGGASDPKASVQRCGSDWNASTGNLRMELDSIPGASAPAPEAGVFTVQAAQLSPALDFLAGSTGAAVSFGAQGAADASVVTSLNTAGQILPDVPMQVASAIPLASFGQLGFAVDVAGQGGDAGDGGSGAAHLWMSLAQSLDLVDPTQNPAQYFAQPTSYLVAVVGDPAGAPPGVAGDAGYDGTGLHLLVLPLP